MRTRTPHILPGCPWCNQDHDPDIRCRWEPESVRFRLAGKKPAVRREVQRVTDQDGKVIAVKHIYREG